MELVEVNISEKKQREECYLAIGFFDGLHSGHQLLLDEIKKGRGAKKALLTFDRTFKSTLAHEKEELLLTREEMIERCQKEGIDLLYVLPFKEETVKASIEDFLSFLKNLNPKMIVVGEDFTFAYKASGNVTTLHELEKDGIQIKSLPLLSMNGEKVSTRTIKKHLKEKEIRLAHQELGYPFFYTGKVNHGYQNGSKINFPTANLTIPQEKLTLPDGVYYTTTLIDGKLYPSMTNIGKHPTIQQLKQDIAETNIFDFDEDLYGKTIRVYFLDYIRDEKKFASLDELKEQLSKDKSRCRELEKEGL